VACPAPLAGAGVAVAVSFAPGWELSVRSPAALIGTEIQPPVAPSPQADAGGFPAQWPTRCPDASLTSTVADAGHVPVQISSTCSAADVTCVPLTPAPADGPENSSVPGTAPASEPATGYSRRV
jgi:hypothetical protein